ncbi:Putative lipoyltransferase 2, mitochondrial [Geodia barretti]|uniref:lipoyl(octanoyl) transferase n=1 Tax=Geodia barretti TaxID=519541 RepID=A0AA35SN41_GEOBA|nr:Putative lipoyltransferase 2, mitochondrial [Geodia barretti]
MALVRKLGRVAYAPTLELQLQLAAKYKNISRGAVRRGGLATFHGPGQLVCYPILNLRALNVGIRDYVHCLEKAVVATCTDLGVAAHTTNCTGVWVGPQKVCALGIQVSHGVSFHGLGLNCCPNLSWFDHIVPCGIPDLQVTSLSYQLNRTVTPDEVAPLLVKNLAHCLSISYH